MHIDRCTLSTNGINNTSDTNGRRGNNSTQGTCGTHGISDSLGIINTRGIYFTGYSVISSSPCTRYGYCNT